MKHLNSLAQADPNQPTCLAIGAFDGVHRGHQQVLRRLVRTAQAKGYRAAALTFFPLPKQVVRPPKPQFYLTSSDERARLLHQLGVELVITHPFNKEGMSIRAADFVDQLVTHLNVREIWVGPDFALGYQREGDVPFLQVEGQKKGFVVRTVDFITVGGMVVKSTLVRQAVSKGRVEEASRFLGRPFCVPGRVVHGDGRGRQIGFPTANLEVWEQHAAPARGVYAAQARLNDDCFPAAVNIGTRPTFSASEQIYVEAHLLDFQGDLYGQEIALEFVGRIRDEVKFKDLDHLLVQLEQDVVEARRLVELAAQDQLALAVPC